MAAMENVKITFLGDSGIGKTCALISFTTKTYPIEHVPHLFGNNGPTCIMLKGQPVGLGLIDTTGSRDLSAQHQLIQLRGVQYPGTDVFVLCYSIDKPESLANIVGVWNSEVNHYCQGTPTILLGLKADLRTCEGKRLVTDEEVAEVVKMTGAVKSLECSALTNQGLDEAMEAAALVKLQVLFYAKKKKGGCKVQ